MGERENGREREGERMGYENEDQTRSGVERSSSRIRGGSGEAREPPVKGR